MAQVLVTGGAGFIGSHLVEALLAAGHRVRVADDLSTGRRENLDAVAGRVELLVADLADPDAARRAVEGCELVFHQAARPSVPYSLENPAGTHAAGATAALNVLEAARRAGARRVVLASSSSVYGETGEPVNRETAPPAPLSPYGATKAAGELYAVAYRRAFGLETVVLRYFNVYGPRQPVDSPYAAVVPKFLRLAASGEPLPVYGDGTQSRDFTHVADVVEANLLAATAPAGAAAGEILNVAAGRATTVLDLVGAIGEVFGRECAVEHLSPRPGDILHSGADISRARARLGYAPKVSLREGLRRTLAALRDA